MSLPLTVKFLILFTLIGANLPFINQRIFALIPAGNHLHKKSFWFRLIELAVFYILIGGIAYLFEAGMGNVFSQGWEFFAITVSLFIVFAFPGFVFQYLFKGRSR
jgi:hypothetical protein